MSIVDGYKTELGGAGFILTGVGKTLVEWYEGEPIQWEHNLGLVWIGITIIGGRSAAKKKWGV